MPDVISVKAEFDGSAEGAKKASKEAAASVDAAADKVVAANRRMGESADAAARKVADSAKRSGMSLDQVGSSLTTKVTLPLTIAGGASIKAAMDFETSFAHIEGLVGITGQALDDMRDKVLDLSGAASGKGPQELAEGLYFITSSGLQGAEALDALEVSAKAAASGLGTTAQVADAVTSAVAAYSKEGLTAAEATDIMVATVKEGKIEADQLASTLGTVIPIASTAGVSLAEVGGAAAILSRNGASAGEAMTQVRSFIDAVIKPSKQAANELDNVGLSTARLKRSLDEDGLLATMRLLRERFGDNTEGIAKWAGRIEAMNAILAITNGDAAETDRIFRGVAESAGLTDAAFAAVEKTTRFKLNGALAEIQESAVDLGGTLLPVASDIFSAVGDVASGFAGMDQNAKNAAIAVGLVAAAAGPTIKAIDGIRTAMTLLNTTGGALGLGAGALLAGGAVLWMEHRDNVQKAEDAQRLYTDALREMKDPTQVAIDQLRDMTQRINDSKTAAGEAVPELEGMAAAVKKIFEGEDAAEAADKLGASYQRVFEIVRDGTDSFDKLGEFIREGHDYQDILDGMTDSQRAWADELLQAERNGAITRGELLRLVEATDAVADATDDHREAQAAAAKVSIESAVAAGIVSGHWREQAVAANGGRDSLVAWIKAAEELARLEATKQQVKDFALSALGMNDAFKGSPDALDPTVDSIDDVTVSAKDATEALEKMRDAVLETFDAALGLENADIRLAEAHQELWQATEDTRVATETYGEESKEVADLQYAYRKQLQDVKGAVDAKADAEVLAAVKQAEANGVTLDAHTKNMIYRDALIKVRDATGDPALFEHLSNLISVLDLEARKAWAAADALAHRNRELAAGMGQDVNYTARDSSGTAVVRRAVGGPLTARQVALVGEDGPELFVSNDAGTVLNATQTARALQSIGVDDSAFGGFGPPAGRFAGGPARGGQLTFAHELAQPAYKANISGLTSPMVDVGPGGRHGPFRFPSEATPRQPFSNNVVVNVKVDGWANADPKLIGKAAYQGLLEEARRRGNAGLRQILVSL